MKPSSSHIHRYYRIHGMDCAEEVSLLRRQLSDQTGIYDLTFDVLQARMAVEFDPGRVSEERIRELVGRTGMRAEPWVKNAPEPKQSLVMRHWRTISALASGAFLGAGMVLHAVQSGSVMESLLSHEESTHQLPLDVIGCYVAAMVIGFHWAVPKAWAALRNRRPDMNLLMAVSMSGASFLGEWSEGATLAFLYALAGLLESGSMARARRAVTALLEVSPSEATVMHGHGEHRMPVAKVTTGSVVRVKPGERIPCDGQVISGESSVNQALITGESVPVAKGPGSGVYAGTINGSGSLDIRTTHEASDTTLARIVRMVQSSTQRRAPSEQFVEKFARYYTPAVFALAALVGSVPPLLFHGNWAHWFYQSMVILLISCPCALVISTPVSIVSAIAAAARRGILVKGGAYLEESARLKGLAFDKTGVLTEGEPQVQQFVPLDGRSEERVLSWLAGLESQSEHPLGRAILKFAEERNVRPAAISRFQSVQGRGAQAEIDSQVFWAGNERILSDGHELNPDLQRRLAAFEDSAHTAIVCGVANEPWAVIGILDPVRPEAKRACESLRRLGIETFVMLTGDNAPAARAVGQQLCLSGVHAELLPEDKVAHIEELRRAHGSVAMVGDGVNDAQAMAAASVGIALGNRATDVALETADIILMSGDLEKLPLLIRHARRAAFVIRQNVVIALALKAAFLAAAMTGSATLWMAVLADMGATILVIFNGLRLLRVRDESNPNYSS